jgi:gliding motility-associated-like protein
VPVTCGESNGSIQVSNVFGGTSPYTYSVNNGAFGNSNIFIGIAAGNYQVTVMDANGCKLDSTINLGGSSAGPYELIFFVEPAKCGDTAAYFYDFGVLGGASPHTFTMDELPFLTNFYLGLGSHVLEVTDNNGCKLDTTFSIFPPADAETIYIPNVFTPNGDAANPVWFVTGSCIQSMNGHIFNRWGNVMRNLSKPDDDWNGIWNGDNVVEGVYFYKIDVTFFSGLSKTYHGHITVKY